MIAHSFPQHSIDYKGLAIIQGRLAEKAEPVFIQFAGRNLEKKAKFFDETKVYYQVNFKRVLRCLKVYLKILGLKVVYLFVPFSSTNWFRYIELKKMTNVHCSMKAKQIRAIRIRFGIPLAYR